MQTQAAAEHWRIAQGSYHAAQVRQKLYKTAIGKWRRYEDKLQPIMTDLHAYIEDYEATLGGKGPHDEL